MFKKIAFIGAGCVGKTTLLESYRQKFDGNSKVCFVEEAARIFFTRHPEIKNRFSVETQGMIQTLALHNEKASYISNPSLTICDRSVLDAVAYVRSQGDIDGSNLLYEKVTNWMPTYTTLFLLDPHDIPFESDTVRKENDKSRQKFHKAFLEVLTEKGIPYVLLSGTLDERIRKCNIMIPYAQNCPGKK